MMGEGRYRWVDVDGTPRQATHWDALPREMDRLVAFVPDCPAPPHTARQHAEMATCGAKLQEALARCRR